MRRIFPTAGRLLLFGFVGVACSLFDARDEALLFDVAAVGVAINGSVVLGKLGYGVA